MLFVCFLSALAKQWGKTYGGVSEVRKKEFFSLFFLVLRHFLFFFRTFFRDRVRDYFFSLFW